MRRLLSKDHHQSVLVSSRAGLSDVAGLCEWHTLASTRPLNYAISIPSDSELAKAIRECGFFFVNFMGLEHSKMLERSGKHASNVFDVERLEKKSSDKFFGNVVANARAVAECQLLSELESGDHSVFLGRVCSHYAMDNKKI